MKRLVLFFLLFPFHSTAATILSIDRSTHISTPPGVPVRLSKNGVVSIKDLGGSIRVTAKKIGVSSITIGSKTHEVHVVHKKVYQTYEKLKPWVVGKRGLSLDIQHGHLTIIGRFLRFNDFVELGQLSDVYNDFQIRAKFDSNIKDSVKNFLKSQLLQNHLPAGVLQWAPRLQMSFQKLAGPRKSRIKKLLAPFGVLAIEDSDQFAQTPTVKIQLYIAHMKKSFLRQWGMSWPTQFSASIIPKTPTQLDTFALSLNAMETQGWGKNLATPTLVTESGQMAEFSSGGEFPVVTTTQFANNVQWKEYGLRFQVTPRVSAHEQLHIDIKVDLSSLDHNQASGSIPALNRSVVKTKINMAEPRPFLISGLIEQIHQDGNSGLPWLSQIPIFKSLFSSRQIYNDEYELVFILLPKVMHE